MIGEYQHLINMAIKQFEADLGENQETRMVFFQGAREITMRPVGLFGSEAGLLIFYGRDDENKPIDFGTHYSSLSYALEAVEKEKPRRFGFGRTEEA